MATNADEQVKAFAEMVGAVESMPDAVVLIGNLLVAKHTPVGGTPRMRAQALSAAQMRKIEENPGILATPDRVLEMLAIAMSTSGLGTNQGDVADGP